MAYCTSITYNNVWKLELNIWQVFHCVNIHAHVITSVGVAMALLNCIWALLSNQVKKLFIAWITKMVTATNLLVLCYDKDNTP